MTKDQFLAELQSALTKLPVSERQDILQDYTEYFRFGQEEGKTEEQIAESLGSPMQIAKDLTATYRIEKVEATATTGNIFRAVWAVIGLGFFNLIIVLAPFIAFAALILAGWAAAISFIAAPLLVIANVAIYPEVFEWFDFFVSIALSGIGIFIAIGMLPATRWATQIFVRYLKFNVRIVKGGLKHD